MEKTELIRLQLSSAQGRRDEQPNVKLGKEIAGARDTEAVKVLVGIVQGKEKKLRRDAIKALYEAGNLSPTLLLPHTETFVELLDDVDNRMQWGGMTALECVSREAPLSLYPHLTTIMEAAEKGSVITRDHAVKILENTGSKGVHREEVGLMLNEIVLASPVNQLPNYAERACNVVSDTIKPRLLATLQLRLPDLESEVKRKRVLNVIKKLLA